MCRFTVILTVIVPCGWNRWITDNLAQDAWKNTKRSQSSVWGRQGLDTVVILQNLRLEMFLPMSINLRGRCLVFLKMYGKRYAKLQPDRQSKRHLELPAVECSVPVMLTWFCLLHMPWQITEIEGVELGVAGVFHSLVPDGAPSGRWNNWLNANLLRG